MDELYLNTFPGDKIEALTMLYLQNQDLSGLSPTELLEKYQAVYKEIDDYNEKHFVKRRQYEEF